MIPMTYKEMEPITRPNTLCCFNLYRLAKCVSLHGIISTLLLPLTVQVIGRQYGVLIYPNERFHSAKFPNYAEMMTFTDVPTAVEAIPISLLVLMHLLGFISVLKKSGDDILIYFFARMAEMVFIFFWAVSVAEDSIKSHVMSQFWLRWCCVFSLFIEFFSMVVLLAMVQESYKNKLQ
ncbi:hypothetical protein HCN44_008457 [Aphidius gifuensis]|uniref:Uncharacterized protein n=1 Tax=Aphidius gifuensis TaxID=684658 RepID=A0A834XNS4_APHGI|nr:uncharacterized protein LOC122858176 isoform X2 [Aphidius gifuensis]KAF7989783.1 hypothetical protein HCN44_008457 [Aphidius gifuensis]